MEKKEKAKKEYSTGTRKWPILFGLLILVAIIVVIVLLVIPANTYSMVETLQTVSQTSFLSSEVEKESYDRFYSKYSSSSILSYYTYEINYISTLSETLGDVLIYYNEFMVFANDNDTLKNNYKTIKDNLDNATEEQKELNNIMSDVSLLADNSVSYLQNAFVDFRAIYYNWLVNYRDAIKALSTCYANCFGQSINNNEASYLILNTVNDFANDITNDFRNLVNSDVKGDTSSSNYNFISRGKIDVFEDFVDNYLNNNYEITNYMFNSSLQSKYETINKFFELYNEPNFYEVIHSINANRVITKTYTDISDSEGVYTAVKNFIV